MINAISNTPNVWTVSPFPYCSKDMSRMTDLAPSDIVGLPLQVASPILGRFLGQLGRRRHRHRFR